MSKTGRPNNPATRRKHAVKSNQEGVFLTEKQAGIVGGNWYERQRLAVGESTRKQRRRHFKSRGLYDLTINRRVDIG